MTELLRRVVAEIEQLPEAEQDAIAEAMQEELVERKWDALLASPASQRLLEQLAAEALREHAEGRTRDIDECW